MRRATRRRIASATLMVVVAFLWFIVTVPWGMPLTQLVVFLAPGALIGLGTSWAAFAFDHHGWNWKLARRHALLGALLLPPVLAFLVALDGNTRPPRLLAGFVRTAWLAFAMGVVIGVVRASSSAGLLRVRGAAHRGHDDGTPAA